MNFYSASVALLYATAMGFSAPSAAGDPESVQATLSLRDVDLETIEGKTEALGESQWPRGGFVRNSAMRHGWQTERREQSACVMLSETRCIG